MQNKEVIEQIGKELDRLENIFSKIAMKSKPNPSNKSNPTTGDVVDIASSPSQGRKK